MTITSARIVSLAGMAVLVGFGYYVGVQVGIALRFPPATTSVLWPPNAILTAAMLLTPSKRWWVCLAGALPVHFWVQSGLGWSPLFIGALFLTNCSEALIAAGFIRALSDAPLRFDSLRRVVIFVLGAGVIAPVLSSFADAAVVQGFVGEPFWRVWGTRVLSNSLTELSVVPLVILVVTRGAAYLKGLTRGRVLEGCLLAGALVFVAVITFGVGPLQIDLPGVPSTPTVFVLPIFLWAALRFGAGGMSLALLVTALAASFAARTGSRPFSVLGDPAESLMALQMYLVVMAVPLFAVSALLDERRRAMAELGPRLQFEAMLSELSRSFMHAPRDRISETFDRCLRQAGEFFGVDRVAIMEMSPSGEQVVIFKQWSAQGVARLSPSYSCTIFPWVVGRLRAGEDVVCHSIADLPKEAHEDRSSFARLELRSGIAMPLVAFGSMQGVMSLHMVRSVRTWDDALIAQLRMPAELFARTLGRMRADEELRSSESMKTAILASLPSLVAVLDKSGAIIAVNEKWSQSTEHASLGSAAIGVGTSYLEVCRRAVMDGDRGAGEALAGIESVLEGRASSFSLEYHHASSQADAARDGRWFTMTVTPLQRPEGGAVVSHVDVTERKRAELDAQRARQDLAHFSRVSTMGELTASLAHQLNQPLTGILSNAQTARRILEKGSPDLAEVREIVRDIIDDDRRAGKIIQHMRGMMTKDKTDPVVTNTNILVRDTVMLMSSDTIIRNVPLTLELAPEAPSVRGDRIELQQVLLNLLMNALEAVSDQPVAERAIVVRSAQVDNEAVLVSVRDSGPGLRPGTEGAIFDAFFTTKQAGMGMGLAIARSIVEAHGGRIWATNNGDHGATFFVQLPLANGLAQ
jgi:signal transduction histidine kinase/integral membrane sensor domain MASE1